MREKGSPNWVSITTILSVHEEEVDVNSSPSSFRWRERRFTGQHVDEWKQGRAPVDRDAKLS
jgi:hypothetical protein